MAEMLADLGADEMQYLFLKTVFHIQPSVLGKQCARLVPDLVTRFGESGGELRTINHRLHLSIPLPDT